MDEAAVIRYVTETFPGVNALEASGDTYFIYDPERDLPPSYQQPFATLVTGDRHDQVSDLERPGVFRLNVGVSKATYRGLLGAPPGPPGEHGVVETGHDFAVLDQVLPHPVYAPQSWICVLSPSEATFERMKPWLAEAYGIAVRRVEKRAGASGP
jgi:hypothetical protein